MGVNTKLIVWIAVTAALLPFVGCSRSEGPTRTDWQFDNAPPTSTVPRGTTAVESAIALSDKYAKLSEEAAALRQRKQTLDAENQRLKDDLQSCRVQSEQAQKELTQANDLLLQTRIELNNWKNDVLGFRGEMQDAQKAQLEALLKILKLMGGEVNQPGNIQTQVPKE
jgi:septal ring factor EnvC (AmiA/AmiB activator)